MIFFLGGDIYIYFFRYYFATISMFRNFFKVEKIVKFFKNIFLKFNISELLCKVI